MDKNGSDNKNHNIDLENNNTQINLEIKTYINEQLYTFINKKEDINPNIIPKINIISDGNCLYRSISFFIYNKEDLHLEIRKSVYDEAMSRINLLPYIFIDYEGGKIKLHEYINLIKNPKF